MTIRIINAVDWSRLEPGNWIDLSSAKRRLVKLEVNSDFPTRYSLVDFDEHGVEQTTFLGVVQGWEKIEIVVGPQAKLQAETEGEVWWFTNDGFASAQEIPNEHSFTTLLQRKSRSDQMEIMLRLQQENYNRLLAQQERDDAERVRAEAERAEAARAAEAEAQRAADAAGEAARKAAEPTAGPPAVSA